MKSASAVTKSPSQRGKTAKSRSRSRSRGRKTRSRSRSPARKTVKKEVKSSNAIEDNDTRSRVKVQNVEIDRVEQATVRRSKTHNVEIIKSEPTNIIDHGKTQNVEAEKSEQSSSSRRGKISTVDVDKFEQSQVLHRRKFQSLEMERTEQLNVPRSSARIAALQTAKVLASATSPAISRELNEKATKLLSEEVDSEEDEEEEKPDKERLPKKYSFGAFLQIILMPCLVIFLHLACTRYHCTILKFPRFPVTLPAYFDGEAILIFVSWILLQVVLMLIPIGYVVEGFPFGPKNIVLSYRLNGVFQLVLNSAAFAGLAFYKFPLTVVYEKFLPLMVTSIIFSLISSLLIYLKACRAPDYALNTSANTGSVVYDFFSGHECHPRLGSMFDLKIFVFRFGMISWAAVNICLLYKCYIIQNIVNIPLAVSTGFQFIYILDYFLREESVLSTATFQYNGLGYELVLGMCSIVPFVYTLPSMFLINHRIVQPYWYLAACGILFLFGYFIYWRANSLKHAFRRNPYSPSLASVESIPTSQKKRLITSGLWGVVQHPNYLGDIIMTIAWTLPCGFDYAVPFFPALFVTSYLMVRAVQVGNICKRQYGPAWDRYTEHVPYRIFPYIF